MTIWRLWIAGQVDASITAAVLIAVAMLGRRRLTPSVRSTLLLIALLRLALPPFVQAPWSEAAASLPLINDARGLITTGLQDDRLIAVASVAATISLALLGNLAWTLASTRRRLMARSVPAPGWLHAKVTSLASRPINADVRISDEIGGPLAAGIRRHLIILPTSLLTMEYEALDAVLAHEVGHHERKDLVWIAATKMLVAIAWFNPLAHLAARAIVSAREDGSDDWALARTSVDRFGYARALLASARSVLNVNGALAAGAHPMGARLRRLLDDSSRRDRGLGWAGVLLAAVVAAAALPGAHAQPVQRDLESDNERIVIVIRQ